MHSKLSHVTAIALLGALVSCSDAPPEDGSVVDPAVSCEVASPRWQLTLPGERVRGVGAIAGSCGRVVALLDSGARVFDAKGAACATIPWPAGFGMGSHRALRPSGVLVTGADRKRVFLLDQGAVSLWHGLPLAGQATVLDADQGPCGHRFVSVVDGGAVRLVALAGGGASAWQLERPHTSVAVSCDAVYLSGAASIDDPQRDFLMRGWVERRTLGGALLWRTWVTPANGVGEATGLASLPGSVGVFTSYEPSAHPAELGVVRLNLDGAMVFGRELGWWVAGNHSARWAETTRAVAWPGGATTWAVTGMGTFKSEWRRGEVDLLGHVGPSGVSGGRVFERSLGGAKLSGPDDTRGADALRRATGAAATPEGGLIVGGEQGDADGWLVRLPVCATPTAGG